MAKYKRTTVGSVCKHKKYKDADYDPLKHPDYISVVGDHVLKSGSFLNLESKAYQLASLDSAEKAGKLSQEMVGQIRERLAKIPDFVRFQIIAVDKGQ